MEQCQNSGWVDFMAVDEVGIVDGWILQQMMGLG
jgi:hypothetical protein